MLPKGLTRPILRLALQRFSASRLRATRQFGQYQARGPPEKVQPQARQRRGSKVLIILFNLFIVAGQAFWKN
jgi:hypothetical protein